MYSAHGAAAQAVFVLFCAAHVPLWLMALGDAYLQVALKADERVPPLLSVVVLLVAVPWLAWLVTRLVQLGTVAPVELLVLVPALFAMQAASAPIAMWVLQQPGRIALGHPRALA